MIETANLWRVVFFVANDSVNAFEEALTPFCEAILWLETDKEGEWRVEGLCQSKPDATTIAAALGVVAGVFSISPPEI